ncbi:hypothetical protein [Cerasicoccus fimbriatus]|uniref:hypothetical protein n=1 Tax=Cerasicoccus fimbriatus TaxID=3014554 RepID=UPI0022B52793|nr:hypothetical protein [Cerasicoccus sp. TK19100]
MNLPKQPLLVIDAASPQCFVGLWRDSEWLATATPESPALEGIFAGIDKILCDAKLSLADLGGFVHNEGPGSILGIRLSAMAIRTWKSLPVWRDMPVWSFGSLHWVAAAYQAEHGAAANVISEFRHGRWNLLTAGAREVVAVEDEVLASVPEPLLYYRQRKTWKPAPTHAIEYRPSLMEHPELLEAPGLLRPVAAPDVFVAEEAVFQKWTAERHRS